MYDVTDFLLDYYKYSTLAPIPYDTVILFHKGLEVRAIRMEEQWVVKCGSEITICNNNELIRGIHFITEMSKRA